MITDKLKELEVLKQKAAALEAAVAEERQRELVTLPKKYGFDDMDAFVDALLEASGRGGRRRGRPGRAAASGTNGRRRKRAKITDETRAEVKKLVDAGKTGAEIAKSLGISLPSVQNIKKALGLVQARKK